MYMIQPGKVFFSLVSIAVFYLLLIKDVFFYQRGLQNSATARGNRSQLCCCRIERGRLLRGPWSTSIKLHVRLVQVCRLER